MGDVRREVEPAASAGTVSPLFQEFLKPYGKIPDGNSDQQTVGKSKMVVQARDIDRAYNAAAGVMGGTASGLLPDAFIQGRLKSIEEVTPIANYRQTNYRWLSPQVIDARQSMLVDRAPHLVTPKDALAAIEKVVPITNYQQSNYRWLTPQAVESTLVADQTKHFGLPNDRLTLVEKVLPTASYQQTNHRWLSPQAANSTLTTAEHRLLEARPSVLVTTEKLSAWGAAAELRGSTVGSLAENAKKSFLYMAGTAAVITLDQTVRDRVYGENAPSWQSTALTVPLAMALGRGFRGKADLALTAAMAGHVIDGIFEGPSWMPESIKNFTAIDAIPLGLAFAIPTKSNLTKALLVGSTVLGSNAIESLVIPDKAGGGAANVNSSELALAALEKTGFKELRNQNPIALERNLHALVETKANSISTTSGAVYSVDDNLTKAPNTTHIENEKPPKQPLKAEDVETAAVDSNLKDKAERSFSSFENSVEAFKEVGKKRIDVLEQYLSQVLLDSNQNYKNKSQEEKLGAHRTAATLAQALAENNLEHGTRISAAATDKRAYILGGMNMDMGGDALFFLQMARKSVTGSTALTEILMNKPAFGTKVAQQEVADLDKIGAAIDTKIEAIVGKHDLAKTMNKLTKFLELGTTSNGAIFNKEMAFHKTFVEDINKKLGPNMPEVHKSNGELNPDKSLLVAKLLRDQAVAKMTLAAYKLTHKDDPIAAGQLLFGTPQGRDEKLPGANAAKGFDGALEAIKLAERLAPNNPDLPELKAISTRLVQQFEKASRKNTP